MRKHRITDADASTLVTGRAPAGRPELEVLAQSLAEFRAASFGTTPRPSATLESRLALGIAPVISESKEPASAVSIETTSSPLRPRRTRKSPVRTALTWIAGLSLGLKILLGAAVAATAAAGAGAAGVLPFGTQQAFDEVVSVVVPVEKTDEGTDEGAGEGVDDGAVDEPAVDEVEGYDPAEDGNFGGWVSDLAHDKPGTGKEFGDMVSDEAHNKPHPHETDGSQVEEGDDAPAGDVGVTNGKKDHKEPKPNNGKGAH
jgi:hypothetical protein